jgi:cytosine/adenosine deaminase-related metal-dependent hydrolase
VLPDPDPYSTIVYSSGPADVRMTMVDGEVLVRDGSAVKLDAAAVAAEARREAHMLAARASL